VQFLVVYVREAHAIGTGWASSKAIASGVKDPANASDRAARCTSCLSELDLVSIPALIDDMDDDANLAYDAWPSRLILIDVEGRVAYRSAPGPAGFDPEELAAAIRSECRRAARER
jgi:hypothetical protein